VIDILLTIAARSSVAAARTLGRLPDIILVPVLRAIRRLSLIGGSDPEAPDPLAEIIEILKNDPEGNRAIRRLMTDNRTGQFTSMIKGLLRHHAIAPGRIPVHKRIRIPVEVPGREKKRTKGRKKKISVGVAGEGYENDRLLEAYNDLPGCIAERIEDLRSGEVPAVDILEAADGGDAGAERLAELLDKGIAVSAPCGAITSRDEFVALAGASKRGGAPFRLRYPYLYYPPVRMVRALLDGGEIGEIATIRIRATIGGSGGRHEPVPPDEADYLRHPAFDHFPLLASLGGPPAEVGAYLHAMDGALGGQGLVSCRFEADGRYGILECSYAPGMRFASTAFPYDLEAEVSGTDGIVRLRRGMARRSLEAPIHVRTGRLAYSIGVESGLADEWEQVYRNAAAEMVETLSGKAVGLLSQRELSAAFAAREAANKAAELRKRVAMG